MGLWLLVVRFACLAFEQMPPRGAGNGTMCSVWEEYTASVAAAVTEHWARCEPHPVAGVFLSLIHI